MSNVPINNHSLIDITDACDRSIPWAEVEEKVLEEMFASYQKDMQAYIESEDSSVAESHAAHLEIRRMRNEATPKLTFEDALESLLGGG